ncbi:hypothetical protein LINPERHAP1_LOCUS27745 [Linum perenne]
MFSGKPIVALITWLILVIRIVLGCICFRNRTPLWLIG